MDPALAIAVTGLDAHHKKIEIISNNLANANTTGFKRNRAEFEDLAYRVIKQPGSPTSESTNSPDGQVLGTGVRIVSSPKIFTDGSMIQTDNLFDIAVNGRGFLQVETPNKILAYTRAGSLQVNEAGLLVMANGYVVQPEITVPEGATNFSVSEDGIVTVSVNNALQQLGQLQLGDFINSAGLEPIGQNLYLETVSSGNVVLGTPTLNGLGRMSQGSLEGSNVNIVEEMVNMIEAQRTFEVTSKAISAVDSMLQKLSQEV